MEKDNMKENEIESKAKETEAKEEVVVSKDNTISKNDESVANEDKPSIFKVICANALDQLLMVAFSALLLLIFDLVLRMFQYRVVRDNGILILMVAGIYFVFNCIYDPLMKKTKLKNTIAKKILNI
ncbi:hypothetical protein [Clostridium saccharobutylicum]|uniref:RDD domain-containing protein n=1 Tax=Clostridium saccharobutylicum DSM 13864 TaxID=1345695 RepID=U5MM43_CLOSA|nr:hypothetical protein [Clostridium saccharobutylicum]AGX41665.1 hypothetical protein CLSA_c06520 [Clostridium saccharobutylicum DSM 13864]AQR88948.1 hypothetical protein CLOSC_06440 [Clostridium saccharobutylicum]AQR98849.1 hypothetical protein CSACC_06510 [Clostridium saccharobutylicum]AQS08567.1 hypothetical protein CLOBY_06770 [Clostridium saccharobutylicum]AQS12837.1 hypothetical protein CLOSACC_06510 [Clostridium saccharobutylicum]